MSPTIVLKDGEPWLALGSPGGSTIITTVLQMLFNRIDRGMSLPVAIAAPRASQRNTASVTAQQSFIDAYGALLAPFGHKFAAAGTPGSSAAEIGAATAIEFGKKGRLIVVAEPGAPGWRCDGRGGAAVGPPTLSGCYRTPASRSCPTRTTARSSWARPTSSWVC
jgi:gamma-glutamyltranspeptidase/glutathione hydrolase